MTSVFQAMRGLAVGRSSGERPPRCAHPLESGLAALASLDRYRGPRKLSSSRRLESERMAR